MSARRGVVIASDFVAWAALHALTGYVAHRVPLERYERDGWLFRERVVERGGRLYADELQIRRWKHLLPDAGGWFAGGFPKAQLAASDPAYLERFVAETRRAELGHWLAMLSTPVFALWNPWWVLPIQAGYALATNGPCIVAQRYNRIRLRRVLDRSHRTEGGGVGQAGGVGQPGGVGADGGVGEGVRSAGGDGSTGGVGVPPRTRRASGTKRFSR